ncbi:MAG: hypothetical protein ACUVQX_02315 [Candidatus Bathycorpusculaceae bacterium]
MEKYKLKINHLIFGLLAGIPLSCLLLYFLELPDETAFTIALFNFLFVSLIFPLNGTLIKKIFMLVIGNIVGLIWNYLFYLFAYAAADAFGSIFSIPYIILSPFVKLVWIVSFWAMSLTILAPSKGKVEGETW